MKLYILLLSLMIIWCPTGALSQTPEEDPLAESRIIRIGSDEIIGIAPVYKDGAYRLTVEISRYFDLAEGAGSDSVIKVLDYVGPVVPTRDLNTYDITTLDANNDNLPEIVATWVQDTIVDITVLQPDVFSLATQSNGRWTKTTQFSTTIPGYVNSIPWLVTAPLVTSGDFGRDQALVMGYLTEVGADSVMLNLMHYDINDSLKVSEVATIDTELLVLNHPPELRGERWDQPLRVFEFTTGDYNGDGTDELLVLIREGLESGGWELSTHIYAYDDLNNSWSLELKSSLYSRPDTTDSNLYDLLDINVFSGFLTGTSSEQAAISFTQFYQNQHDVYLTEPYLVAISANPTLTSFQISDSLLRADRDLLNSYNRGYTPNSIRLADINDDGIDELFSLAGGSWDMVAISYQIDEQLNFIEYGNLGTIQSSSPVFNVGDIIVDTLETREIPELATTTTLYEISIDDNGNFENSEIAEQYRDLNYGCWYPGGDAPYDCSAPMVMADLDGDIRLGTPRRLSITKVLQPLVILNAPPIHFDMFSEEVYDVSKMYNENEPKFTSTYEKETSESKEVTTEFNRDWGISGTLSADASYLGVSVSGHLTKEYGEKFSKTSDSGTSITVNISVDAIEDDRIYATVLDYDVWEYPVLSSNIVKGHVLVVDPVMTENRWFPSKSWSGYSYIPEHEVGNILSYREYARLSENPSVDENGFIKGDYNNSFVLDGNSSYNWSLEFQDFISSGATTQKEFGTDWGASIGGWGVKLSVDGHYSREQIQTQRTEVSEGLFLGVHLDALDLSLGEVAYRVTPYAYWADNGALVIDYAVQPELAAPGGTDTWWQVYYNDHSDPAFIMPWRYDPEKGFTLEDPAKREQTKDITFFPEEVTTGDTVQVTARIHNFSLIPTPQPVGMSFYYEDPDENAEVITDVKGDTLFYTETAIASRGSQTVEMQMVVPGTIGTYPRIYGVIDPGRSISQIHENNNKGWAILGKTTPVHFDGNRKDLNQIPLNFILRQNYPNPFNPSTQIEFSLPQTADVKLIVYDVLGRHISTLVNGKYQAGEHLITFDASNLSSGVYIYRLETENYTRLKKMLLMK